MFLPLVMVLAGEPRRLWRSRMLPVALPMLLFFALFVAIFVRTCTWEHDQSLTEFRLLSQDVRDKLQFELAAQTDSLQQLSASWRGAAPITREDFATLVSPLLQRTPAIQAIEWVPRVAASDRVEFEASQQRDIPGFAIREHGSGGVLIPAGDRPAYYPVLYMEPLHGNEAALGFDLASDPVRAGAIQMTLRNHAAAATTPIRLVQDPGDPTAILLALAVSTASESRGVLVVVLRMDTVVASLLGSAGQALGVQLVDSKRNSRCSTPCPRAPHPRSSRRLLSAGAAIASGRRRHRFTLRGTIAGKVGQSW